MRKLLLKKKNEPKWLQGRFIWIPHWVYTGSILGLYCVYTGSIWVCSGSILGLYWVSTRSILALYRSMLDLYWIYVGLYGSVLGLDWNYTGSILGFQGFWAAELSNLEAKFAKNRFQSDQKTSTKMINILTPFLINFGPTWTHSGLSADVWSGFGHFGHNRCMVRLWTGS